VCQEDNDGEAGAPRTVLICIDVALMSENKDAGPSLRALWFPALASHCHIETARLAMIRVASGRPDQG